MLRCGHSVLRFESKSHGHYDFDTRAIALECALLLQAKELKSWGADGVIVGSALVRALGESSSKVNGKTLRTLYTHRPGLL